MYGERGKGRESKHALKTKLPRNCRVCEEKFSDTLITCVAVFIEDKNDIVYSFKECSACGSLSSQDYDWDTLYADRESSNYSERAFTFISYLKHLYVKRDYRKLLMGFGANAQIVDYGCGSGELSNALYSLGFRKIVSADLQFARPNSLLPDIDYKHVDSVALQKADVIVARHVWEHIPYPVNELKNINKQIKESTKIILEVPNKDSCFRQLMGKYWPGYFAPYHTVVYSENGLRQMALNSGFEVIEMKKKETPILGVLLKRFGFSYTIARLLSGCLFPIQRMISNLMGTSEALLVTLVKKCD